MSPTRTPAERDAITIEIMFALVSGAFVIWIQPSQPGRTNPDS
ncbi:DUF6332 family protein [Streptomyces sp. NPDC054786]